MSLTRLAYASEATFEARPPQNGVEPNVARILMESRRNNADSQIVGGLYYGDGAFFQYLEGEEQAIKNLYQRISRDSRHKNVMTLIEEPVESRTFANWSMKYVPLSSDVTEFLRKHRMTQFAPSTFTKAACEDMIELIRRSSEQGRSVSHDGVAARSEKAQSSLSLLAILGVVAALGVAGALVYAGTML